VRSGAKALGWMLVFLGLEYYVHKKQAEQLERDIDLAKHAMRGLAATQKAAHPDRPVYLTLTIRSVQFHTYYPFLGWFPQAPQLGIWRAEVTGTPTDPPVVAEQIYIGPVHPGEVRSVTYSELLLP
jgi:hypothetical protein